MLGDGAVGDAVEMREIRHDRQDAGALEAERLEILAIEFGIAEREVAPFRIGAAARAGRGSIRCSAIDAGRRRTPAA